MKIVCDACSAKYSIADDKVKGKVFKIRCKKCSNIIVVRGNAGAGAEEAPAAGYDQKETRVYDYQGYDDAGGGPAAEDAVWHLVIDQEQVGPIAATEVQRRFAGGEIDGDTYIWREGFGDWQPLTAVDAFAGLFSGSGSGAARAAEPGALGASPDDVGTARSDPGDLFAAAGPAADDGGDDAGADLFGGAARSGKQPAAAAGGDAALFGGGGGGGADKNAAAKAAAADKRLRGERNENSVLFSLNNLAALASDAPRTAAPSSASSSGSMSAAATTSSSGSASTGGGEGSGLIDIRSMASTYLSDKGAPKSKGSSIGTADDLPVFSSSAFHEPAVIMPSPASNSSNSKLLYALIGVVALLAVVAVVLVVVVFTGKDKPGEVAVNTPPSTPPEVAPGGGTPPGGAAANPPGSPTPSADPGTPPAGDPSKAAEDPKPAVEEPKPAKDEPKPAKDDRKSDRRSSGKDTKADKPDRDKPAVEDPKPTKPAKPEGGGGCLDEVGCLLADKPPACCSKFGGGKKPSGGGGSSGGGNSNLPEELDRAMISTGVGKVRGRIEACGSKSSAKGEVKVSVKVAPGGSVASVSVKSSPDSSLGACVASAMEKAAFAKTQNGGSFSYPFIFR